MRRIIDIEGSCNYVLKCMAVDWALARKAKGTGNLLHAFLGVSGGPCMQFLLISVVSFPSPSNWLPRCLPSSHLYCSLKVKLLGYIVIVRV